jgi:hypothetical protein
MAVQASALENFYSPQFFDLTFNNVLPGRTQGIRHVSRLQVYLFSFLLKKLKRNVKEQLD